MQKQVTHVLVIDDNDSDIEVVRRYLRRSPQLTFQTYSAHSLEDGIVQAGQHNVDAILLDLNLTDSEGIDTLRTLLEVDTATAIIVLTGHDEEDTALEAIHVGAQDYLVKDKFTAQFLIRTIRHAIERASSIQLLKVREQELLTVTAQLQQEIERRSITEKTLEDVVLNKTQALDVQMAWRKRAEEELEHTEKDLQYQMADLEIIFRALPDAIVFADNSRRIRKVSAAITTLFGYTPDELLDKPTAMLYANSQQAKAQGEARFSLSARETFEPYDMVYRRQDGTIFTGETIGTVVRDGSGEPLGFIGIIRDVTQQRQLRQERDKAQTELARREIQLQQFIKHMPATVAMFDTQMQYLFYSDRWLTDYGIEATDITGHSHYDVFPEIPSTWKEDHQNCLSGDVLQNNEDIFVRQDGKTDWLKWELRPWYEPSGEVGGILMLTEVITAQKTAQIKLQTCLQDSETRFRTFMDHSFAVTFMKDAAGRYLYTNWKFEQVSGLSQASILGKTDSDWLPSKVAQRLCQH
ncbi:MAG: PAS domain S-box protein, partial [Elainellaceae cyanobacterium]